MVVALLRDPAEVGPFVVHSMRLDRSIPGTSLFRHAGSAVQVGRRALSIIVRAYQSKGGRRQLPAPRRDMGRNGYKHAIW